MSDEKPWKDARTGQPTIALIICYFGPLPSYSECVFKTAAFNDTIDWLIFSDQPGPSPLPSNVHFIRSSLDDLRMRFQDRCGCKVSLYRPADICNFRPAFGHCFREYLEPYQFWGHTDLDVLYGDLRSFLGEQLLMDHSRIYCRGHLSVYRNSEEVNRLFMLDVPGTPSYVDVFANPGERQFDEWKGIHRILRYHGIRQYHAEVIADIRPPTRFRITRFEAMEIPNHKHQIFYWYGGKTFQAYLHREGGIIDREVAYIHFQKRKLPPPDFAVDKTKGFGVGPHGFYPYTRQPLSVKEFAALNPSCPKPLREIISDYRSRAGRRLRKLFTGV